MKFRRIYRTAGAAKEAIRRYNRSKDPDKYARRVGVFGKNGKTVEFHS